MARGDEFKKYAKMHSQGVYSDGSILQKELTNLVRPIYQHLKSADPQIPVEGDRFLDTFERLFEGVAYKPIVLMHWIDKCFMGCFQINLTHEMMMYGPSLSLEEQVDTLFAQGFSFPLFEKILLKVNVHQFVTEALRIRNALK